MDSSAPSQMQLDSTGDLRKSQALPSNTLGSTLGSTAKSAIQSSDDLRKAREFRASEALKMKDEQLQMLSDQNSKLLDALSKMEEDTNSIHTEKLSIEQENRTLRDQNFELQSKSRAAETQVKKVVAENNEKDKQLRTLTDQHSELLRLLESEENLNSTLQSEVSELRSSLEDIRSKYATLLATAKSHEDLASKAIKEGQLHVEEIRILRTESEHLKQNNVELKMKTQVELEAMQEQLRVRKEKQYQLLEKLQALEEAKKHADDQVNGMDEQLRSYNARNVELDTQLSTERQLKINFEETNRQLLHENNNIFNVNKELNTKIEKSEKERLRMEAEARDNGEQLREMAEKVFQLLERLKLSELGKVKAMEALKKKENDFINLEKKNSRLLKDITEEGKLRAKAELDIKVLQEQVRVMKKTNTEVMNKSKEDTSKITKLQEENSGLAEKVASYESRLSFLLNKVQMDEDSRLIQTEDRKKLEGNMNSLNEKCNELTAKLQEMGESNRIMAQALRIKQDEYNDLALKHDQLTRDFKIYQDDHKEDEDLIQTGTGHHSGSNDPNQPQTNSSILPDDIENVRLNEGRGRFYVEAKTMSGGSGSLLLLRGKRPAYREWLRKYSINEFIKKSQKSQRFRELIIEKLGQLCGLFMVEEEDRLRQEQDLNRLKEVIDMQQKKLDYTHQMLSVEESAKGRMLLRYIQSVKEHAMLQTANSSSSESSTARGVIQLSESNVSDEEMHALAALLRNNNAIEQLNLRNNNISDEGARALASVLAGKCNLRLIDLRGNKISKNSITVIAEALKRAERVRHVYVHAGGKIEALGGGQLSGEVDSSEALVPSDAEKSPTVTVETVCVVDVRDNNPAPATVAAANPYELLSLETTRQAFTSSLAAQGSTSVSQFQPRDLVPPQTASSLTLLKKSMTASGTRAQKPSTAQAGSALAASVYQNSTGELSEKELKAQKLKRIQAELKENAWQGRSGGIDPPSRAIRTAALTSSSGRPDTQFQLPPLTDLDGSFLTYDKGSRSLSALPSRGLGSSPVRPVTMGGVDKNVANDSGNPSEALVRSLLIKAKRGQSRSARPSSETEKRLFNSPFAQSILASSDKPSVL